ncbi:MAG: insulinase family protein [Chlamydiales bacterium]|nr:insulinase family protein [Chlamydiales bacterium]
MKKLLALVSSFEILVSPLVFADSTAQKTLQGLDYQTVQNQISYPILNPSLRGRAVEKIQLKNGLQVYLISDPDAKQSAAGLCVEAGSWNDPKEFAGMAHFCEHMLFMGNKAYPSEFEYMQYIADHGGKVNASTWPDRTIYMFSVNNDSFEGALDRFSHFFIDPLFLTSCIQRELHAVDQEHAKNIEHDGWRQYMVFKETGNPLHPNASFSTGNAKTLGHIPQEALKKWYDTHYSSDKMHLVVLSPLSIQELTPLVASTFSQVPVRENLDRPLPEQVTSPQQRGHMIYLKPVKDLKALSMMWEIPSVLSDIEQRSMVSLVSYVLGNETKNSLLEQLKREKLADSIRAGTDLQTRGKILFTIDIDLTAQGVAQADIVIARVFQTLSRLKEQGIPSQLFEEMKKMAVLSYQYQSREDAFQFISKQAHDILDEDLTTYPEKTLIPTQYDSSYLSQFLRTLTPESCIYFLQADPEKTGVQPDRREKWMNAEYAIREVPQNKLTAWSKISPHPQIGLPRQNPFLPDFSNFAIGQEVDESTVIPTLLADDRAGKLYHATDRRYLVPEMFASFALKTSQIDGSAKAAALSDLYIRALTEKLSSTIWYAQTAGMEPQFGIQDLKFVVHLSGYHFKAPLLLKEIFRSLKEVHPTKEEFELYRQTLLSNYENGTKELPLLQARELLDSILYNDAATSSEKLQALKTLSYDEFISFSKTLFKSTYIEGLVYGNLENHQVKSLWEELKGGLGSTPLAASMQQKKQLLLLPEKRGPYLVSQTTPRQGNGVILVLEEGPFSFEKRAAQEILGITLHEAFFDTLRTKQQTAYIAKAWPVEKEKQLMQFFAVQSSTHHPSDLIARFELFLENFVKMFPENISPERFEELKQMLTTTLQMPPENLYMMGQRLNKFAFEYDGDFSWIDKRIGAVSTLTYEKLNFFAKEFLSRNNLRRLAVLMEGVLNRENDFHYEQISKEDICDLGVYISSAQ